MNITENEGDQYEDVGTGHINPFDMNENDCYGIVQEHKVLKTEGISSPQDEIDPQKQKIHCTLTVFLLVCFIILTSASIVAIMALSAAFVLIANLRSEIALISTSMTVNKTGYTCPVMMNISDLHNKFQLLLIEIEQRFDIWSTRITKLEVQASNLTSIHDRLYKMQPEVLNTISELEVSLSDRICEVISNSSNILSTLMQQVSSEITNVSNVTQKLVVNLATSVVNSIQAKYEFESCVNINTFSLPFRTGEYLIRTSDNNVTRMNCTLYTCDGVSGGWKRVAYLDVDDPSASACPNGLQQRDSPLSCRRPAIGGGCSAVTYAINDNYKCIFGRINADQVGTPDGFQRHGSSRPTTPTINNNYVDGVSLTHGSSPRTHIWTYAATTPSCTTCSDNFPAFLDSSQYTCDANSGCTANQVCGNLLWNGKECEGTSTFYRQLPQPTSDDIEIRVCRDEDRSNEDFLLTFIEIYVV